MAPETQWDVDGRAGLGAPIVLTLSQALFLLRDTTLLGARPFKPESLDFTLTAEAKSQKGSQVGKVPAIRKGFW